MNNETSSFKQVWPLIINEIKHTLEDISSNDIQILVQNLIKAKNIFVAGTGRSGLVIRCFAMRMMQLGLKTYVVGETNSPAIKPGDLLLIGSGSGTTNNLVNYANRAIAAKARLALITTASDSPITKLAEIIILISAPTPKLSNKNNLSHQPMATLFEQVLGIILDGCVMLLMEQLEETEEEMFRRHANLE
tara:strand:- start:161628 stop:162200 length:573 start_codon:yes stop_codon:yes gene_type:complete